MIKVGLIGAGMITKSHREAYKDLRKEGFDVQVVAVADIRPEFTEAFKDTERIYGDYHELLEAEVGKLDYVDICLPTFMHAAVAITAMDMGYNVICEKPMAMNPDEAQAMIDASKRNNVLFMIAHCRRFRKCFRMVKKYIDEKLFGDFKYAHLYNEGGTPKWSWEGWHFDEKRSGGVIMDMLHDTDLVNYFFGVPKAVTCVGHKNWPGSGYDRGTITYMYDNDVYVTSDLDWTSQGFKYGMNAKTFVFEKGYITYGVYDGKEVLIGVDKETNTETDLLEPDSDSYPHEMRYYINCLVNHKSVDYCPPEQSRENIKMVMAEIESADKNGERIEIK